ncbi:MAG: lipopolysaccharide biosynthesis protein [Lachnospiraceae bacterium]
MSREKELVKNTAIVAVGRVCTKLLSFFLLPFYTSVLSTEDYGIVDLLNTYVSLLLPLVVFQIEDALFRFMIDVRDSETERNKVISTTFFFCLAQSVLFMMIYFVVQSFIEIPYKEFLAINLVESIFSGALLQLTRGLGDNYVYAFGSFLNALTAILLNIVFVLFMHMGAKGMFLTVVLTHIVTICYIVFKEKVYRHVRIRSFDRELLKNMLSYSLPLVPNILSWWVMGASDKSIVSFFMGISANGILSVSQKFSTMYTTFYSIFNLTWTENASIYKGDADRAQYYSQIIETSFRVLASACLGIIACVAILFPWLINARFGEAYYQIPIYMLSSLVYSVIGIFSVVYIADKRTKEIAKTSMIAAALNVLINVVLIRHIGLYAASVSSVAAYAFIFTVRYFDIQKIIRIRLKKSAVISTVFMMILDFIVYYLRINWLSVLNLLLVAVYALILNRKILSEIIRIFNEKMRKTK